MNNQELAEIELRDFVVNVERDTHEVIVDPVQTLVMLGVTWTQVLDAFPAGLPEPRRELVPGMIRWSAHGVWPSDQPLSSLTRPADFVFSDHGLRGHGVVTHLWQATFDGACEVDIIGIGELRLEGLE